MEKEKKWSEDMAKEGLVLTRLGIFKYYFVETDKQDLVYQFHFQILNKQKEESYLELFEDWTLAAKYGSWYYFYKPNKPGEINDIYMDNKSRRSMFRRILGFLAIVAFPLYYQLIFIYPQMNPAEFAYPKFYFFMRIIVLIFLILWCYAVIRIVLIARHFKSNIKE